MPNSFAYLMLMLWPIIVFIMFRKMPIERALVWSILGGYLFLPPVQANLDLPMIPAFDKVSIPNLSAFFICVLVLGRSVPLLPGSWVLRVLLVLFVASPVLTILTNADPVRFNILQYDNLIIRYLNPLAADDIPGLRLYDSIAAVANQAIFILPFFLARQILATPAALREILVALMVGGLIYSVPMLIEIRLSPQLNTWVYGFFQHDFGQMIRAGGYRPIVFLPHGLWMAFFAMTSMVAAVALVRAAPAEQRPRLLVAAIYLAAMLVLCRSLGPILLGIALAPLVLLAGRRVQLAIAAAMALTALIYPLLRGGGLVPVETLLAWAEGFDPERARSLRFRFDNESALLARAAEKPWFGWGSWGRNMVYDPYTGENLSVTDGRWIIVIGVYGWAGYIVEFGLLSFPLFLLVWHARHRGAAGLSPCLGPLALVLGANMIDLLPNATLVPFTWLLAGALMGHAELLGRARDRSAVMSAQPLEERRDNRPAPPRTIL